MDNSYRQAVENSGRSTLMVQFYRLDRREPSFFLETGDRVL